MFNFDPAWVLYFDSFDPDFQRVISALLVLGNGHISNNGAAPEATLDIQAQEGVALDLQEDALVVAAERSKENEKIQDAHPATKKADVHYPATYLAGGYNTLGSPVGESDHARVIPNEDLVNWPDWTGITWRVKGENEWFLPSEELIVEKSYRDQLNMKEGMHQRSMIVCDKAGRATEIVLERFVSMADADVAGLEYEIKPLNWGDGKEIEIRSMIDGSITNYGVPRYRKLAGKHYQVTAKGAMGDGDIYLEAETTSSKVKLAEATKTTIFVEGKEQKYDAKIVNESERISQEFTVTAKQGETIRVEKRAAFSSFIPPINPGEKVLETQNYSARALKKLNKQETFEQLKEAHKQRWDEIWNLIDIEIEGPTGWQQIVRTHLFHVAQTMTEHSLGKNVNFPARGWTGESYRGHIFWDNLYLLYLLMGRNPQYLKESILYRFHRLDAARKLAEEAGYQGAMYPWQGAMYGDEQTPPWHLCGSTWEEDISRRQRHNNLEILIEVWRYYEVTHNKEFMRDHGAELILSISQFLSSLSRWDEEKQRFVIEGVIGPDEYHEDYPGQHNQGINNNSYTNILAAWALKRSVALLSDDSDILDAARKDELRKLLKIEPEDEKSWKDISEQLYIPTHKTPKGEIVISQYENQGDLPDFPKEAKEVYTRTLGSYERMDRIQTDERTRIKKRQQPLYDLTTYYYDWLEAKTGEKIPAEKRNPMVAHSPNSYKDGKQTDGLPMALFAIETTDVKETLERLGHPVTDDDIKRNILYSQERCYNGSTLSKIAFAAVLYEYDPEEAMRIYELALKSDVESLQAGNTTSEGIHLGVQGGSVGILMWHFAGVKLGRDVLEINPNLPKEITKIKFKIKHANLLYLIDIHDAQLHVTLLSEVTEAQRVKVLGHCYSIVTKETCRIAILGNQADQTEREAYMHALHAQGLFASSEINRASMPELPSASFC